MNREFGSSSQIYQLPTAPVFKKITPQCGYINFGHYVPAYHSTTPDLRIRQIGDEIESIDRPNLDVLCKNTLVAVRGTALSIIGAGEGTRLTSRRSGFESLPFPFSNVLKRGVESTL